MADTMNDSTFVTSSTSVSLTGYASEWEERIMNEPTNKCRYGY